MGLADAFRNMGNNEILLFHFDGFGININRSLDVIGGRIGQQRIGCLKLGKGKAVDCCCFIVNANDDPAAFGIG